MNRRRDRLPAQGLVEFALLLPVLLMIILGTIEFGRILFIYTNINNAAREGTRYGMVHPKDQNGITNHVTERLELVSPSDIMMNITYDSGPNTGPISMEQAFTSDRVIVTLQYTIQPLTPLLRPLMPTGLMLRAENRRTIQTVRTSAPSTLAAPAPPPYIAPTETPTPGGPTPTHTFTPAPTETLPPTATRTPTPTPTFTPTPIPAIVIDRPVIAGDTTVTGRAAAGFGVTLRVIQTGLQRTVAVAADGTFTFSGLPSLIVGHTVVVQGYDSQDLTIVQDSLTPTVTATATASPVPTATPAGAYITIDSACLRLGTHNVTVRGRNISNNKKYEMLRILWDGATVSETDYNYQAQSFDVPVSITIDAYEPSSHTLAAQILDKNGKVELSLQMSVPVCAPEQKPDLVITNLAITDDPLPGTYERLHLSIAIMNAGTVDVTSLFWVDLFADYDPVTPLPEQASVDYVAVNALGAGSTVTFTMYVPNGFETVGDHKLIAMVDTWNQIDEIDEANNVSEPISLRLTIGNLAPTPTPEITPGPTGVVLGTTRLGALGQANVAVFLYDADGRLWGSTRSATNGLYDIPDINEGQYTVIGQFRLGDVFYVAMEPVTVVGGAYSVADLYLEALP